MTVTKEKSGNVLNVAIEGALDINTAPQLQAELDGELDDVTEVYFDMAGTDYTSSAGLRVLLGAYQILDEKDGRMVLKNVNPAFMEILELTGFTDFIEIEN
jgi:anti-sigma B factor antagonist